MENTPVRYVESPSLPSARVACAICGGDGWAASLLRAHRIDVRMLKICTVLPKSLGTHTDMLCCHLGRDKLLIAQSDERFSESQVISVQLGQIYPADVPLNCAFVGRYLFANTRTVCCEALEYAQENGIQIIDVHQGYTRCSIAPVSEHSIITADRAIAKAAQNDFDVLLISPGHIRLEGYDYGFIGGACGKISKDVLAFFGNIKEHPDYLSIERFANEHGCQCLSLSEEILTDVGGFIPYTETA